MTDIEYYKGIDSATRADKNGVLAVPAARRENIKERLEFIRRSERVVVEYARRSEFPLDGFSNLVVQ